MEPDKLLPLSKDVVAHFGAVLVTLTPSENRIFQATLQPEIREAKWATLSRAEQLVRVGHVLEDIIAERVQNTESRAEQLARIRQVIEGIIRAEYFQDTDKNSSLEAERYLQKDVDGAVQAELLKVYIYRRFYRMIVYVVFSVVSLLVLLFFLRNDSLGLLVALAIWAGIGLLIYYQWVKK